MVVARNAGEAKEARKATRQFREMKVFSDHKLRIGKVHNNQKHVSRMLNFDIEERLIALLFWLNLVQGPVVAVNVCPFLQWELLLACRRLFRNTNDSFSNNPRVLHICLDYKTVAEAILILDNYLILDTFLCHWQLSNYRCKYCSERLFRLLLQFDTVPPQ